MKYLNLLWLWHKNIFVFGKPIFSQLDYADYIIQSKGYFVFTWKIKNAYRLKIKSIGFKSVLKSGSAYIALHENDNQLEIIISGVWRSKNYLINLKRISINNSIDFPAVMCNNFEIKLNLPTPEPKLAKFKVDTFKVQIIDKKRIKSITNISYPN